MPFHSFNQVDSSEKSSINWPVVDPLEIALEKISESKRILECVITSSENFDYPKAKEALRTLEKMIRELGRAQAKLKEVRHRTASNVKVIDFKNQQAQR